MMNNVEELSEIYRETLCLKNKIKDKTKTEVVNTLPDILKRLKVYIDSLEDEEPDEKNYYDGRDTRTKKEALKDVYEDLSHLSEDFRICDAQEFMIPLYVLSNYKHKWEVYRQNLPKIERDQNKKIVVREYWWFVGNHGDNSVYQVEPEFIDEFLKNSKHDEDDAVYKMVNLNNLHPQEKLKLCDMCFVPRYAMKTKHLFVQMWKLPDENEWDWKYVDTHEIQYIGYKNEKIDFDIIK